MKFMPGDLIMYVPPGAHMNQASLDCQKGYVTAFCTDRSKVVVHLEGEARTTEIRTIYLRRLHLGAVKSAMVITVYIATEADGQRSKNEIPISFSMDTTLEEVRNAVLERKCQHVVQVVFDMSDQILPNQIITPNFSPKM